MSSPWRPLFSGPEAAQILSVVQEIAAAVSSGAPRPGNVSAQAFPRWRNTLSAGLPGQSLLQAYLAFQGAGGSYGDMAIDLLDQATDAAAALRLTESLYFGFTGIAWVTAHLTGRLFEEDEDSCLEIDELLLGSLSRPSGAAGYELLNGVVGLGVYALERLPRSSAVRCLEAVVAHLEARAERSPEGIAFLSPPETLRPKYRDLFPQGTYSLGMAHGLAGVIAFLGSTCRAGVATRQARSLLMDAVSWLLARELPAGSEFRFPNHFTPGAEVDPSALAWCHGDLGIATALLVAARGVGEASWESEARRIAGVAAARPVETSGVLDAGLCHGAAGVGHLFNRLYQTTGEGSFGEAARFWLRRALALREPGLGFAGYRLLKGSDWFDAPGFREGAAGVGLALLAAVSNTEPGWDRLLLASPLP
jgi:lantibiotic modifying enzyme